VNSIGYGRRPAIPGKGAAQYQEGEPANKVGRARKPSAKPKADRANKKAEVIAVMKRAKGVKLTDVIKDTGGSRTQRNGLPPPEGRHALEVLSAGQK